MSHYFEVKNMYPVTTTPALDRATEALHPYWSERYPSGSQAGDMAKDAVSAALHDPEDPAWPLSALGRPLPLPTNPRDWSPAMREAYSAAAEEHGFTAGNQAAQRVFMIESAAKLRSAILGEA